MAINISENNDKQVTYDNQPDVQRTMFPNISYGASDEQIAEAVDAWLTEHPEATTTVQDGSLLPVKLDSENEPGDGYVLCYNGDNHTFEWVDVQSDITHLEADVAELEAVTSVSQIVNSASGAVASFADGADNVPVRDLVIGIEPVQAGSGDPAPDNVRPISGWTGANVYRTGVNLCGGKRFADELKTRYPSAVIDTSAKTVSFAYNASAVSGVYFPKYPFKENTRYTFILSVKNDTVARTNLRLYYTDLTYTDFADLSATGTKERVIVTSTANKTVLSLSVRGQGGTTVLYYDESGVFEGVITASDFVPYNGNTYPISWQTEAGTVYGGNLDVTSGVLTVGWTKITIDGTLTPNAIDTNENRTAFRLTVSDAPLWVKNGDSNKTGAIANWATETAQSGGHTPSGMTTPNKFALSSAYQPYHQIGITIPPITVPEGSTDGEVIQAYMDEHPLEIAYPLYSTAISTYQLTPTEVKTLLGQNNIWSDTGDTEVTYCADPKLYVDSKVSATQTLMELLITANRETGTTASKAYTAGDLVIIDGTLYSVASDIANGGTFTVGTNVIVTTVAEQLSALA